MQKLTSYEFKRESNSRYAPVAKALIDDGVAAVRLRRGEDFPQDVKIENAQGGISTLIRKRGRRARTFVEDENNLVVALWPEGEGPSRPRRRRRETAAV